MKTTSTLLLFAFLIGISSCSKLQHCRCSIITNASWSGLDTTIVVNGPHFKDTEKNGEEYCSHEYQTGLQAAYPGGTITCEAEANE